MPVVTRQATANTPNGVTNPTNTGHDTSATAASIVSSTGLDSEEKGCEWSGFATVAGAKKRVTIKFTRSASGTCAVSAPTTTTCIASCDFIMDYSINNGSNWTTFLNEFDVVQVTDVGSDSGGVNTGSSQVTFDIPNPASLDITQIRVRDRIVSSASVSPDPGAASADMEASVSNLLLEVEIVDATGAAMFVG